MRVIVNEALLVEEVEMMQRRGRRSPRHQSFGIFDDCRNSLQSYYQISQGKGKNDDLAGHRPPLYPLLSRQRQYRREHDI